MKHHVVSVQQYVQFILVDIVLFYRKTAGFLVNLILL